MKFLLLLLFFCGSLPVFAQTKVITQHSQSAKVVIAGDTLQNPWSGGLNAPVFSTLPLNQDSQPDLFVYDRMENKISTFLAVQRPTGSWYWQYAPQYETFFPKELGQWVLLRDYNCDGLKDIFTHYNGGIRVYEQVAVSGQPVSFQLAHATLQYNVSSNFIIDFELPVIDDADGDGDLDILYFDFAVPSEIRFYKNRQVEDNLPCGQLKYELQPATYAGITSCVSCNSYAFNANPCRISKPMHTGGHAILAIDLDGDSDKDLLIGKDNCTDIVRITNTGTPANAQTNSSSLQTSFPPKLEETCVYGTAADGVYR